MAAPIETDAVVIGAGPVGLFQVFELGLLDIHAHVIDSLPFPGGQCVELYPDKPIYDIPATPVCSGRELVSRLLRQIEPFRPTLHLNQQVDRLTRLPEGRFEVGTSGGTSLLARTVFIAAGVGSFQPRRLKVEGLASFEGSQVFYRAPEPAELAGRNVVIVGDGDTALECALRLASEGPSRSGKVTLLHRRDEFKAAARTVDDVRRMRSSGQLAFVAGQPTGVEEREGRMTALLVATPQGGPLNVALDVLIVLNGLSPRLGPIADWGLALERKQIVVDTEKYETGIKGIFAVGDVNTYPGKKKLILCGFHEATLAAFGAAAYVHGGEPAHLEYTTTSTRLHKALGVAIKVDS